MTRIWMAVAVVAVGIIGAGALSATAGEPKPPATVRLTADIDSAGNVDSAPEGDSVGDIVTFTQKLTDANGKAIGTSDAFCIRTAVGKSRECQGTFYLPKGQVFVQGPEPESVEKHSLAIVGGTRAYSDVGGHVSITHLSPTRDGAVFTFKR